MAKQKKARMHEGDFCYCCGAPATDTHHCIFGKNRINSEIHGLTVRLCRNCHNEVHFKSTPKCEKLKRDAQVWFEERSGENGHTLWMEIFGRNYL